MGGGGWLSNAGGGVETWDSGAMRGAGLACGIRPAPSDRAVRGGDPRNADFDRFH